MDSDSFLYRLRASDPDVFHSTVKMHLSFLLDLSTDDCDCNFVYDSAPTPQAGSNVNNFRKKLLTPMKFISSSSGSGASGSMKGIMDGATLTMEGVCQVYQLIQYLSRPANITVEGIFRKHGNLKKQQVPNQFNT